MANVSTVPFLPRTHGRARPSTIIMVMGATAVVVPTILIVTIRPLNSLAALKMPPDVTPLANVSYPAYQNAPIWNAAMTVAVEAAAFVIRASSAYLGNAKWTAGHRCPANGPVP